jgi:hypothetical protein
MHFKFYFVNSKANRLDYKSNLFEAFSGYKLQKYIVEMSMTTVWKGFERIHATAIR